MKKTIIVLAVLLLFCGACQQVGYSVEPTPSVEGNEVSGTESEADGGVTISTVTTYVSQKALLAALRDEKAMEKDTNLQKVKYWYELKNIPEGNVEYACRVSDNGNVQVQYVTEESYQRAEEYDPTHVITYEQPLTITMSNGYDFARYTEKTKSGRFILDRAFYVQDLGHIDWLEGEDYLTVQVPWYLGEDNDYYAPKLTDEEVIAFTEVVRVDPFK